MHYIPKTLWPRFTNALHGACITFVMQAQRQVLQWDLLSNIHLDLCWIVSQSNTKSCRALPCVNLRHCLICKRNKCWCRSSAQKLVAGLPRLVVFNLPDTPSWFSSLLQVLTFSLSYGFAGFLFPRSFERCVFTSLVHGSYLMQEISDCLQK